MSIDIRQFLTGPHRFKSTVRESRESLPERVYQRESNRDREDIVHCSVNTNTTDRCVGIEWISPILIRTLDKVPTSYKYVLFAP